MLFIPGVLLAEDFYWEKPEQIRKAGAWFPQYLSSDKGFILCAWQEYDRRGHFVSIHGSFSDNGTDWSQDFVLIEPFEYRSEDRVSLFSLSQDRAGTPLLALKNSEQAIQIFRLDNPAGPMKSLARIGTSYTSVVPRLFRRGNGALILFLTGKIITSSGDDALSLYSSESDDARNWSKPEHFIRDPELKQNFLPFYSWDDQGEYVIFQSLYTGRRNTYQLYMKTRAWGEAPWSGELALTNFEEYRDGEKKGFAFFDNQRPHFALQKGMVHLVWERRFGREAPQIYHALFDGKGALQGEAERVSGGTYFTANPRIKIRDGEDLILWFDNRNGNQVIMARQTGIFWEEINLSLAKGNSTYPCWIESKDALYIFWENVLRKNRSVVELAPDHSAPLPYVRTDNFLNGKRQAGSKAVISWFRPKDSSGIKGFSFIWDRQPDTEVEHNPDALDYKPGTGTFEADEDGAWYFHIALQDYAGNWSGTKHIQFIRDTTPPEPVVFDKPLTDAYGYLVSNTFRLSWHNQDAFPGGCSYAFYFLGEDQDFASKENLVLPPPPSRVQTARNAVEYSNRDNGVWALSVIAFDDVGNKSTPAILLFKTNKYVPVTYISDVKSRKDDFERMVLTIIGRGFHVGGDVNQVILDRDGKKPWDYVYDSGDFRVESDRVIEGPAAEVLDEGFYKVAVSHPGRGMVWAEGMLKLDSRGTLRFGDFSYSYKTFWETIHIAGHVFNFNDFAFYGILFFLVLVSLLSAWRIWGILVENRLLEADAEALVQNRLFRDDEKKERIRLMRQKGLGLRQKFVMALLTLILAVILLIAGLLGQYMINTERETLARGLYDKASLLLETLATGARTYLPTQNRLELGLLPNTIRAMDAAISTTITGQGRQDPDHFSYIWSSNKANINEYQVFPEKVKALGIRFPEGWSDRQKGEFKKAFLKKESYYDFKKFSEKDRPRIYEFLVSSGFLGAVEPGLTQIHDPISSDVALLEEEINKRALELIGDQSRQLDELTQDALELALGGDAASVKELQIIQDTIARIEREVNDKLGTVASVMKTYPEFNVQKLNSEQPVYTFYKPVVYRNKGRNSYFRGIVRLNISVSSILDEIAEVQYDIIRITVIISFIALAGGLAGALFLAQTMINPIRKIVAGVAMVRDTQDKAKLAGHSIEVRSKDELAELARTFNQMIEGLVKAAATNKELTLGKEIQKKFIPLETLDVGGRKLSTGEEENDFVHFFGYYEGAKGVSGDYFDFRRLDDKHYGIIKCDISGKGISAALIMVEVATIFIDFFSKLNVKRDGIHLEKLVTSINDLLVNVGFEGRFAAFIVTVINIETGQCWMCHAGDKNVYSYDGQARKVIHKELNEAPAAGVFPSDMVMGAQSFKQVPYVLKKGDILFLFTDGIEEAQRHFRNADFEIIDCDGSCDPALLGEESYVSHKENENFEELGIPRIERIIEAVLQRQRFRLFQYHKAVEDAEFSFDFTSCEGTVKEAVLALIAVEKIFRLVPDPKAGLDDRIRIDNKIDEFLKVHFDQYRVYFRHPVADEEFPEYTYYAGLKEDEQFDDLTILGIYKK